MAYPHCVLRYLLTIYCLSFSLVFCGNDGMLLPLVRPDTGGIITGWNVVGNGEVAGN